MNKTIVFVNSIPAHIFGGGEKWMYQTAYALYERGYHIGLVARPNSQIIEKFREFESEIYPLKFGSDFNPLSIFKLVIFFKKMNVSHLILNFNKDVSIAGIAGRMAGVEKILFRNGFPLINKKLKHRALLPFFDILVTNSQALVMHYTTYNWGLEDKMKVIYNGIKVNGFYKRNFEKATGEPYFIFGAGRLAKIKRFDVFIDIVARLKQDFPVQAVIAGDGPELQHLKLLSDALEGDVEFLGYVPSIYPFLNKADIFLHTSRNEGIPNVVMEAMSQGLPVVVTNAGGTNELVKDKVNGLLCEIDDIDGLYHGMKLLLNDMKLRERLALEAQETIKKKFNFQDSIDQLENLFN